MQNVTITIQPYSKLYMEQVVSIANGAFGDNYLTAGQVARMNEQKGSFYIGLDYGRVVGYCCFLYEPAQQVAHQMKLPFELSRYADENGHVCYTKTMAVADNYRGTGLAADLFERCLRDAVQAGLRSAWGSAWKIEDVVPMDHIFKRYGFQVHSEVPLIWYDNKQYRCIICNGPCRCTGVIYYKPFIDQQREHNA